MPSPYDVFTIFKMATWSFLHTDSQSAIKELGKALVRLDKQVTDLYFSFRMKTDYSSVLKCFAYGQFWIFYME